MKKIIVVHAEDLERGMVLARPGALGRPGGRG